MNGLAEPRRADDTYRPATGPLRRSDRFDPVADAVLVPRQLSAAARNHPRWRDTT